MGYALAGIPLCIIMFQSVGERLNTFVTFVLKQIKRCFRCKNTEVSQTDLIFVTMNLSTVILTTGALVFSYVENWKYIDSFYYCFITLTTIGFGDFVALQKENVVKDKPHYFVFSILFILVGLTVISAAMNLLVLRFLTMNTEDERRDVLEAAAAARNAVHLDGDVITGNGGIVSNAQERPEFQEVVSVCSCSCYKWRPPKDKVYNSNASANHVNNLQMHSPVVGTPRANTFRTISKANKEDTYDEIESFIKEHQEKRTSL